MFSDTCCERGDSLIFRRFFPVVVILFRRVSKLVSHLLHFSVNNGLSFSRRSIANATSHTSTHMCILV